MANLAASIVARLGLDTGPLKRGLKEAERDVGGFAKSLNFLKGTLALIGVQKLVQGFKEVVGLGKELNPALKHSEETLRALNQESAGLTDAQLEALSKIEDGWLGVGARIKGFFAQVVLSAEQASAAANVDNIAGGGTGGFFGNFKKAFAENGNQREQAKKDAEARAAEAAQEKVAGIHNEIVELQRADATSRISTGEKILEIEERIAAARAAQFNTDPVLQAGAEKTEAKLKIEKAALVRQEKEEEEKAFQQRIDAKLVPLDDRRGAKSQAALRARTGRAIKKNDESRDLTNRLNGRQLSPRNLPPDIAAPNAPKVAAITPGETQIVQRMDTLIENLKVKV